MIILGAIAAQLRPGYNPVTQFGSELGAGADAAAIVSRISYVLTGLLTIAFAMGLQLGIKGPGSKVGPVLLGLYGLGWVGGAFFPCDPGCPLPSQGPSVVQSMHWTFFIIATISTILYPLIISKRLRTDDLWKGYRNYSIATSVLTFGFLIVFYTGVLLSNLLAPWRGTFEILVFLPTFIWIEVVAIRLLRLPVLPTRSNMTGSQPSA